MQPSHGAVGLPDDWQLHGFDDDAAEWWLRNGFDCAGAVAWRGAEFPFDPDTAAAWVESGAGAAEASEWMWEIEETDFDYLDALDMRGHGQQPWDVPGRADAAFQRAADELLAREGDHLDEFS
jgi:hypothetical protein